MPIYNQKDSKGYYYRYGNSGKKYYYNPLSSRSKKIAYAKSLKQTQAIHAN
jgi:hypothetical protein